MSVYQPLSLFIYLLVLGIIYTPVCIHTVSKQKLNFIEIMLVGLSMISYSLVGLYMVGGAYYSDGGYSKNGYSSLLSTYGLPELTLLSSPYIFVGLAVFLVKKC
ncbi:hypothetical protein [Bacillus sp. 2205SS5-2]|uniref:hypothetical protein n=1 Tax=Bacillus sp. 2205SS5-2 TaxID=3109031 RepID=UPI003005435B